MKNWGGEVTTGKILTINIFVERLENCRRQAISMQKKEGNLGRDIKGFNSVQKQADGSTSGLVIA